MQVEGLERAMVGQLREHLVYWSGQMDRVEEMHREVMQTLQDRQGRERKECREIQERVHSLLPRDMQRVEEMRTVGRLLVNARRVEEALGVGRQIRAVKGEMHKERMEERKMLMGREREWLGKVQAEERVGIVNRVREWMDRLVVLRRKEWDAMWSKYNRLVKANQTMHGKEDKRLQERLEKRVERKVDRRAYIRTGSTDCKPPRCKPGERPRS